MLRRQPPALEALSCGAFGSVGCVLNPQATRVAIEWQGAAVRPIYWSKVDSVITAAPLDTATRTLAIALGDFDNDGDVVTRVGFEPTWPHP